MWKSYSSLIMAVAIILVGVGCPVPGLQQTGLSCAYARGVSAEAKHHGFPGGCTVFSGGETKAFFTFNSEGVMIARQSVPVEGANSAYRLENGNYLIASSTGVYEVTEAGQVVFHYEDDCPDNNHTWAARLPNGNTLISVSGIIEIKTEMQEDPTQKPNSKHIRKIKVIVSKRLKAPPHILEVSPEGKVVNRVDFEYSWEEEISRGIIDDIVHLSNGNWLVVHPQSQEVREYLPNGKLHVVVHDYRRDFKRFEPRSVFRCSDGSTIVGGVVAGDKPDSCVFEYDANGAFQWQLHPDEIRGAQFQNVVSVRKRDNGNYLLIVHRGETEKWDGYSVIELSSDKEIVHAITGLSSLSLRDGAHAAWPSR